MYCDSTSWMKSEGRNWKRSKKRTDVECYKEKVDGITKIICRLERSGPELQILELDLSAAESLKSALERAINAVTGQVSEDG
jgi:hypothetical protein